jgi:hypothetical protein
VREPGSEFGDKEDEKGGLLLELFDGWVEQEGACIASVEEYLCAAKELSSAVHEVSEIWKTGSSVRGFSHRGWAPSSSDVASMKTAAA